MKIEYIREVRDSYIQIMGSKCHDYQMKMLLNNDIPGFLKVSDRMVNGETRYLYKISSMMSMEDGFLKKNIGFADLEGLVKSFMQVFSSVENYLMDYNGIVLSPDLVFLDTKSKEWRFVYFSEKETSFDEDIKSFFEYVIRNVNHKDTRAVTMAYGIYKRLCEENINPEALFEIEIDDSKSEGEVITEHKIIESVIPEVTREEVEEVDYDKIRFVYGVVGIYGILVVYVLLGIFNAGIRLFNVGGGIYVVVLLLLLAAGYGGYRWYENNKSLFVKTITKEVHIPYEKEHVRIVLPREEPEEENYTMLLSDSMEGVGHSLTWRDTAGQKRFELKELITVIGSAADRADCVIAQSGVSRIHARITNENSRYYIKDMNSTNGTKVNGRELACYELCEIKSNDRIEFGNFECIFV